jgi:hypothetical protein
MNMREQSPYPQGWSSVQDGVPGHRTSPLFHQPIAQNSSEPGSGAAGSHDVRCRGKANQSRRRTWLISMSMEFRRVRPTQRDQWLP